MPRRSPAARSARPDGGIVPAPAVALAVIVVAVLVGTFAPASVPTAAPPSMAAAASSTLVTP